MKRFFMMWGALMITLPLFSQSTINADSATAFASKQYADPTFFQRFLIGTNYRKEWETPVRVPIFRMKQMGFEIIELGGGMQTKSLKLKAKDGREWALRSVEKDVEPNLPKSLHNTFAERTVQDMISAAHPYAPLTIPTLANAIGVIAPAPTVYFVPDDPDLGEHRKLFANTMCMLEEREPTPDKAETKGTESLVENLVEENDHLVLQQTVLKARLLDMLLGDWDRHADQWRWGTRTFNDVKYYYAIPRDRDQAYFYASGFLPKLARLVALRHLVNYKDHMNKIKALNYKAWDFDGLFLNELNREQWETIIKQTQSSLTDEVISEAMKKLPPEVYPLSGPELERKMKGRRDDLLKEGMDYYDFIANSVSVNGTDKAEIFEVSGDKKNLVVTVYNEKDGKKGRKIYERTFNHSETHRITIYGLGGKDEINIAEGTQNRIRFIIYGGKGADTYDLKGNLKTIVYDAAADENVFKNKSRTRVKSITH